MSLLAELLLQAPPSAPAKRKPGRPKRLLAADIYGPAMRGEGVLSKAELERRTGRRPANAFSIRMDRRLKP